MIENIDYVVCPICKEKRKRITIQHIKMHGFENIEDFKQKFSNQELICENTRNKFASYGTLGKNHSKKTRRKQSESAKKREPISEITRLLMSNSHKGLKDSEETKEKKRKALIGKKRTKESNLKSRNTQLGITLEQRHGKEKADKIKKKLSIKKRGISYEKQMGEEKAFEVKAKRRKQRINQIEKNHGKCNPAYNEDACEWFKKFDEQNNTKGRYAVYGNGEFHIKEINRWLDYINFDLKLIIEIYESHHFDKNGNLLKCDIQREKEIQEKFPDFTFLTFKECDINKILNINILEKAI